MRDGCALVFECLISLSDSNFFSSLALSLASDVIFIFASSILPFFPFAASLERDIVLGINGNGGILP